MALLRRRETCIWLTPMWSAISVCVLPSLKRSLQDLLLLALEAVDGLLQEQPVLQALDLGPVVRLEVDDRIPLRLVLANRRVEAGRVVGPPERQGLGDAFHVGVEGYRRAPAEKETGPSSRSRP